MFKLIRWIDGSLFKLVTWISGSLFIVYAVVIWVWMSDLLGLAFTARDGLTSVRAMYCGLTAALGLQILVFGLFRLYSIAASVAVVALTGLALVRLHGMILFDAFTFRQVIGWIPEMIGFVVLVVRWRRFLAEIREIAQTLRQAKTSTRSPAELVG